MKIRNNLIIFLYLVLLSSPVDAFANDLIIDLASEDSTDLMLLKESDHIFQATVVPKEPVKTVADIYHKGESSYVETVTYKDAFGKELQTIERNVLPGLKDKVSFIRYDNRDRVTHQYLPFAVDGYGDYISNPVQQQAGFYNTPGDHIPDDNYPYVENIYNNHPDGQVIKQSAPGEEWRIGSGHETEYETSFNTGGYVRKWTLDTLEKEYKALTYYEAGMLKKNKTINAEDNEAVVYKDKTGNVILKKHENKTTYYIYDKFDRLIYIIPPKACQVLDSTQWALDLQDEDLKDLIYIYKYDDYNRTIEKDLPDAEPVKYVYNRNNQVIMSSNGVEQGRSMWEFIKYDKFGRKIYQGITVDSRSREELQQLMDSTGTRTYEEHTGDGPVFGYTNQALPLVENQDVDVVNYYDHKPAEDTLIKFEDYPDDQEDYYYRGKQTKMLVRDLETGNMLAHHYFYDKKGRVIQTQSENIFGSTDIVCKTYNFTGQPVRTLSVKALGEPGEIRVTRYYEYTEAGNLQNMDMEIEGDSQGRVTLVSYEYNQLGEVINKKLHKGMNDNDFLQQVDYRFNIRGWLTEINNPDSAGTENDLFGMKLRYTEQLNELNGSARYDGNVTSMSWNVHGQDSLGLQSYGFTYDQIGRLTAAKYGEGNDFSGNAGAYDVDISYDIQGNITQLERQGLIPGGTQGADSYGTIDQLNYHYDGNRLKGLEDNSVPFDSDYSFKSPAAGEDYEYDANGNMKKDPGKGIQNIEYNYFNLPEKIEWDSDHFITFAYNGLGQKTAKEVHNGSQTYRIDYSNGFVYMSEGGTQDRELQYFMTEAGRVTPAGDGQNYNYEYYLKDHLGNVRVSFHKGSNGEAEMLHATHYYPFGMQMAGMSYDSDNLKYLYNGKELHDDQVMGTQLNWYSYGARYYNPQIGRWMNIDPMAEKYDAFSPYNYCVNDPVNKVDPDGMETDDPYYNKEYLMVTTIYCKEAKELVRYDWQMGFNPNWDGGGLSESESEVDLIIVGEYDVPFIYKDEHGNIIADYSHNGEHSYNDWMGIDDEDIKQNDGGSEGGPWYYGFTVPTEEGLFNHAFAYNSETKIAYEIWYSSSVNNKKAQGYKYDLSTQEGLDNFMHNRNTAYLAPVNIPKPSETEAYFESMVGIGWNYSLLRNNCKHYVIKGFSAGGANFVGVDPFPSNWYTEYTEVWNF